MSKGAEALRGWEAIDADWAVTLADAHALPEPLLHEGVDGEWSLVETLRHLVFVHDAWIGRVALGAARPYHRLGLPPDHRIGHPDPHVDVSPWGIDVGATAPLDEVLEARAERADLLRTVLVNADDDLLARPCPPNPAPGFPPMTTVPLQLCVDVVLSEERAHLGFARRDLTVISSPE